jgi:cephalosporin hydroxylase
MNTGLRPTRSATLAAAGIASRATALAMTETQSMVERSRPTTEVAKDSDHTRKTTLTVLIIAAAATRSTAVLWYLNIRDSGVAGFSLGSSALVSSKAGGSSRWRRIR